MSLSSESIQKKEFHIVFKGYKPEEVDKFLDLLAMEFDGMQKKIAELEEKVDSIRYEGDGESSKMKKVIQEALISAHRMAEDIKQKAKVEAEEMLSQKKMEEEKEVRKLRDEKNSLESSITGLRKEYTEFKEQISRFADEFKSKMASVGDGKLMDALESAESDKKKQESIDDKLEIKDKEEQAETRKTQPEKDKEENTAGKEEVLYKHARKDDSGDNLEENDLKDLAALTDEMLEKLDSSEKKDQDTGKEEKSDTEEKAETEEKKHEQKEKKARKKIDIANPDIINDFFKTDED